MPQKSPEQKPQNQISAMGDSVWLINKLISEGTHTSEIHNTIDRNVRHLELMMNTDEIKNSGSDLSSFSAAISDGRAFIATT